MVFAGGACEAWKAWTPIVWDAWNCVDTHYYACMYACVCVCACVDVWTCVDTHYM